MHIPEPKLRQKAHPQAKKKSQLNHSAALKNGCQNAQTCGTLSVCLRDSGLVCSNPCTFGTQLNEILQRPLRLQFRISILKASWGDIKFCNTAKKAYHDTIEKATEKQQNEAKKRTVSGRDFVQNREKNGTCQAQVPSQFWGFIWLPFWRWQRPQEPEPAGPERWG